MIKLMKCIRFLGQATLAVVFLASNGLGVPVWADVPAAGGSTNALVIPVPFTSQAPFAIWDFRHEEACEETSVLMAAEYFSGHQQARLEPRYADQRILQAEVWEKKYLGIYTDTSAVQIADMARRFFQLTAEVVPYDPQVLRDALRQNKLVAVPAAGRLLRNPNFKQPGPWYHVVLVRGFDGSDFIVNDPGTRRGAGFHYSEATLTRAAHDWNNGRVMQGKPVMVALSSK